MNSRDRLLAALRHEMPDRVPLDIWVRPEVARLLADHFQTDPQDALFRLGKDVTSVGLSETCPAFLQRTNGMLEGDCPGAGGRYIFHDDGSFEDAWGVRQRKGQDGKYLEWVSGPLVGAPSLEGYGFPEYRSERSPAELSERVARLQRNYAVLGGVANPFKTAWHLRGMENLLMDFLVHPDFAHELLERLYDWVTDRAKRLAAAGIDVLTIVGDVAMQDRLMMSPDVWRTFDKHRLVRLVREVKALRPDLFVYFHSDGNVEAIIPDLIEAGVDILNPVQPECMDPARIKQLYGDRLTLWGTGSLQRTLPFGSEEAVRREVRETIQSCGRDGGLVLMPSNVVGFDVPLRNLLAYYDEARSFDLAGVMA